MFDGFRHANKGIIKILGDHKYQTHRLQKNMGAAH